MKKFNTVILVLQIIGINFIILAGRTFSFLSDIKLTEIFNSLKPKDSIIDFADKNKLEGLRISNFIHNMQIFEFSALFIGLIISYFIIKKKSVSSLNFASLLIVSLLLFYKKLQFSPFEFLHIENYFKSIRNLIILNGSLFLIMAFIFFLMSWKFRTENKFK